MFIYDTLHTTKQQNLSLQYIKAAANTYSDKTYKLKLLKSITDLEQSIIYKIVWYHFSVSFSFITQ